MSLINVIPEKKLLTQSTLLIAAALKKDSDFINSLKGNRLSRYLARLMRDPDLDNKLKFLKSSKWKKQYQAPGKDLQRLNFYPAEQDWARLSIASNATGFSRCYVFVFLMLVDLGYIQLKSEGTHFFNTENHWIYANILLDERKKLLIRQLQP